MGLITNRRRTREKRQDSYTDLLRTINPAFWTQGYDLDPTAFDQLGTHEGYLTVPNPTTGSIAAFAPAAHGCAFHDFGPGYEDNIEIDLTWNCLRSPDAGDPYRLPHAKGPFLPTSDGGPFRIWGLEATPLLHVNTATDKYGVGLWPSYDLVSGGTAQSFWGTGWIGRNNANFNYNNVRVLTPVELLTYSALWKQSAPVVMTLRSSGGKLTFKINGQWVEGVSMDIPVELRGSTVHGFALDYNHIDNNWGLGGYRPPNGHGAMGPFTIRKL